jgi:hypothetical protein
MMRALCLLACCALLSACEGQPTAVVALPVGVVPVYPYAGTAPGAPGGAPPTTGIPVPDGMYAGVATPLVTDGGVCFESREVTGFQVQGNRVSFGGFQGPIDGTDSVQLVYGTDWIFGQFQGGLFQGQLVMQGARDNVGCSYTMTLRRVGN